MRSRQGCKTDTPESGTCFLQWWIVVVVLVQKGSDDRIVKPCGQSGLVVHATCPATPNPESTIRARNFQNYRTETFRRLNFIQYRTGVPFSRPQPQYWIKCLDPWARLLSSTGLGSGNLIGRAQFPQHPHSIKIGLPKLFPKIIYNHALHGRENDSQISVFHVIFWPEWVL